MRMVSRPPERASQKEVAAATSDSVVRSAGAAFGKLKDFMRQILAVPKKKIDRKVAREKAKKRKK